MKRYVRMTVGGSPRVVDLFHYFPQFPYVSVASYGATGNGVTDDQAAIQNALNAAQSNGLPVFLPPGTYKHTGQLTLTGTTLFGIAPGDTKLLGVTTGAQAINLTGTNPGLHCVTIAGAGASPRTSDRPDNGVYVNAATGYTIRNCHVYAVPGAGIMVENSSSGLVRSNFVEANGADGIYHTEGSHNVEVSYNKTYSTGDDAISVTSYNDAAGFCHDFDIHHNSVLGNWQSRAMSVNGSSAAITIHDNHIDGGTSGISCTSVSAWGTLQTAGVTAYGNAIRNINQSRTDTGTIGGGAISFWNDLTGTDSGLSFHDNRIYNPGLYGIYAGGTGTITASVATNAFYLGGTLFHSDDTSAAITQTGNTTAAVAGYPGDLVPRTVGGIDPVYRYAP